MGCLTDKISADILVNCDFLATSGIEEDVLLFLHSDVDKTASTFDAENSQLCTDLKLNPGATGYLLEGVKQTNGFNSEFVKGDEQTPDKHKHSVGGRIISPTTANRAQANKLSKGEPYMAVVNRKYKGPGNTDAFLVLGWDNGMYLAEMTEGSRDNNGAIVFSLASEEKQLENHMAKNLLEADYSTTLTAFGNKFAEPVVP